MLISLFVPDFIVISDYLAYIFKSSLTETLKSSKIPTNQFISLIPAFTYNLNMIYI
jgi:hypothetical protein